MAFPVLPALLFGGAAVAVYALTRGGSASSAPAKKAPPPPPPPRDKVQTAADKTLEKLRDLKAKADKGDAKARDTLNTMRDLWCRLKA